METQHSHNNNNEDSHSSSKEETSSILSATEISLKTEENPVAAQTTIEVSAVKEEAIEKASTPSPSPSNATTLPVANNTSMDLSSGGSSSAESSTLEESLDKESVNMKAERKSPVTLPPKKSSRPSSALSNCAASEVS